MTAIPYILVSLIGGLGRLDMAMANTLVLAIVLFSIFLGIVMITVKNKENCLLSLQNLSDALMKIALVVAKSAPIGIFALSAAAGTLDVASLSRLQIYLWVYLALWLIFAISSLPILVSWAIPLSYREVLKFLFYVSLTSQY